MGKVSSVRKCPTWWGCRIARKNLKGRGRRQSFPTKASLEEQEKDRPTQLKIIYVPGALARQRNNLLSFFKKYFMYLFMRNTKREAETQAEGETGSLRGARWGTRSQDPGITSWAEGRCSTVEPPGHLSRTFLNLTLKEDAQPACKSLVVHQNSNLSWVKRISSFKQRTRQS